MKYHFTAFVALALGIIQGCSNEKANYTTKPIIENSKTETILTKEQILLSDIKLGKIQYKTLSQTLQVNGMLDVPPQNLVSVSALMGGFIKQTDVLQGLRVKKGQKLAIIQNPDFIQIQQDYLQAINKLVFVQKESERQQALIKENVGALKDFQQASSEYEMTLSQVNALKERLQLLNINPKNVEKGQITSTVVVVSPISGYITAVNINTGKYVNPQDVICEIVDTEHLHAELTAFEKDANKLKIGQKVRFTLVNEPDRERTAKIYLINRKITEDRSIRIHAHLDKEDASLLPYSYLKAVIELSENKAPCVPDEAIVNNGDTQGIFLADTLKNMPEKIKFTFVEIKKGISANGFTEIALAENIDYTSLQIVTKGAYAIISKINNEEE